MTGFNHLCITMRDSAWKCGLGSSSFTKERSSNKRELGNQPKSTSTPLRMDEIGNGIHNLRLHLWAVEVA
jgi:hypothetical protein